VLGQGVATEISIPIETVYGKGVNKDGSSNAAQPGKSIKPKGWMRVWITRDDKWPVPGEFIGILVKPNPLPPHVWWFMRSSPFLYAGNWMDTLDLTSGTIVSKTENVEHPTSKTPCTEYIVTIHGIDVKIYSSDFLVYNAGDRVAIWKDRAGELQNSYTNRTDRSFDQMEQQEFGDPQHDSPPPVYTIYTIIPITFFL